MPLLNSITILYINVKEKVFFRKKENHHFIKTGDKSHASAIYENGVLEGEKYDHLRAVI